MQELQDEDAGGQLRSESGKVEHHEKLDCQGRPDIEKQSGQDIESESDDKFVDCSSTFENINGASDAQGITEVS